ncbi:AraC family transcriptional regulator [Hoeflea prorocentri]|uniref:AraC family transcriptional regulator n=1 Tax=Hoeflea prorocentri TaxID=1922333 RepID=A0A9X3ZJ07_9HYPH|nr:AraC family transcriptional regulator [Hoeflea prorocentri]MCY6382426.1 AraC family transcriptional regulator [Hoeflea prorocentri]MDA5400226.1 AraC family transcriptional regulator [Hoeflea prorocentri]
MVEKGRVEDVGEMISRNVTAYEARPLGKVDGNIEARSASVTTQDMSLVYLDWGAPTVGTSLAKDEAFNLRITLEGQVSTTDPNFGEISAEKEKGNARIFSLTEETNTYSHGHIGLNLVIPHNVLENRVKSFYQHELGKSLRFAPLLDLSTIKGQSILSLLEYFKTQHTEAPEVFDNPIFGTQFQELMLSNILAGMDHNYKQILDKGAMDVAIPRAVKRAEDFMRSNAYRPITIELLAREAGCSERALHSGFRKFRNKTPLSVLRDIRLEHAHSDLMAMTGSVTDIAMKWGFSNLGRFSKSYVERYGERPSQTLKVAPCQIFKAA